MSVYRTTEFYDKISLLSLSYFVRCWMYVYWLLTCSIHYVLGKPSRKYCKRSTGLSLNERKKWRPLVVFICLSGYEKGCVSVTVNPSGYWKQRLQGLKSSPAKVFVLFFKSTLQKKKTSCTIASGGSSSSSSSSNLKFASPCIIIQFK
jgi:hypothetical protein